jgi:DNA transposition AAA+ family ATPase
LKYVIEETWPLERQILCGLLNEGVTCKKVGDEISINRSTVSLYANGKPMGSVERIEQALREYFIRLGKWPETEARISKNEFKQSASDIGIIPTNDQARVMGVCQRAQTQMEMCMLVGAPGTGKTKITEEYQKANTNTFIITCTKRAKTKTILRKTCDAIGIENYGSSGDIEMRIMKSLIRRPGNNLLIFDEADFMNLDSLETIRGIFDEVNKRGGKLGILLCGNEKLAQDIMIYAEERPDYARLRDRVGYFQRLYGLGELEVEKFLDGINCTQQAKSLLINIGVNRGTRQLMMALKRLLEVTKGKLISADLVQELGQIVLSFNA